MESALRESFDFTLRKSFRWIISGEGIAEHFFKAFQFFEQTLELECYDANHESCQLTIKNMRNFNGDIDLIFTDGKGDEVGKETFVSCKFKHEKGSGDYGSPDPLVRTFVFEFDSREIHD